MKSLPFPAIKKQCVPRAHRGAVLWLTGLSGAGKSSLAIGLKLALGERGYLCNVLDGDGLRAGLNKDLGFSPQDRTENVRRTGEVAALFCDAGFICIAALISPYRSDRDMVREICGENFHEIHVATELKVCEARDPKGLYKKARAGLLPEFTGISAPYEVPLHPELKLDTGGTCLQAGIDVLVEYVSARISLTLRPA